MTRTDASRTIDELKQLATFSDVPAPAVTRIVFSEVDRAARAYLIGLFEAEGLAVRVDPVGNIFARWIGSEPDLPAIGTGSHCDAIPHSGMYDGTVGVLGGLAAIRKLKSKGFQPKRSIELVMFTSEEPTRYGLGCLGSRLMAGVLDIDKANKLTDKANQTLPTTLKAFGCVGDLSDVKLSTSYYFKWVELHIEQGPILEQQGIPIGVVEAVAAPAALRCTYKGQGGHAGAVLMHDRKDAFIPAAKLAIEVEKLARQLGTSDTVATTGYVKVHPCAINSIPSQCDLEIDVRDVDAARRDKVLHAVEHAANEIAKQRDVDVQLELINSDPPASCDATITSAIRASCDELGLPYLNMVSRAYHDTLFMAVIAPVSMIFIPCFKGYSHRPDEYASPEAIANGIDVLAATLEKLSITE
jgi:ureidoglycolate amidohydrolase